MFRFLKRQDSSPNPRAAKPNSRAERALPGDVASLLKRRLAFNDNDLGINLLSEQASLARLSDSSVWGRLGLVTLDDAEPKVQFVSLQEFEDYLLSLGKRRVPLDEDRRAPSAHSDQAALAGALLELACADNDADAAWLICLYVGTLREDRHGLLRALAMHENFEVREVAAEALGRIETPEASVLLEHLASDRYGQVVSEAHRAVTARAVIGRK